MDSTQNQLQKIRKVRRGMRIKIIVNSYPQIWDVVGSGKSDTVRKLISCDAPMIQLIWGMESGETIKGQFGSKELFVEIKEISVTPKKERVF